MEAFERPREQILGRRVLEPLEGGMSNHASSSSKPEDR